jgi:hypothetical protein
MILVFFIASKIIIFRSNLNYKYFYKCNFYPNFKFKVVKFCNFEIPSTNLLAPSSFIRLLLIILKIQYDFSIFLFQAKLEVIKLYIFLLMNIFTHKTGC